MSAVNRLATRGVVAAVTAVTLLAGATACTGSSSKDAGPKHSASSSPSARPDSAPFRVQVTHVAGKLSTARRVALARQVRGTLTAYVDAAFLRGDYPRSDFGDAFGSFTTGAAHDARGDQALLTNRPLGGSTTSVTATHRTAYLSVLAPRQHPAGLTAAVDLTFVVDRGDQQAQQVHLKGRLLMTHAKNGRWSIFGYDLSRSQTPTKSAS
jgi:hypothetical protein